MATAPSSATQQKEWRDLVKELAEAVSTQAQVANRTWLALITVALFAVIPRTPNLAGNISLPFNLGEVSPSYFHGLVFLLLIVLAIAFASAHSQQVRAQKLAQGVINSIVASVAAADLVHPRDYFDMLRKPSLNRVSSLAQSLLGIHQFFISRGDLPRWRRSVSIIYYYVLKLVSFIIYFGLPIWALSKAYRNFLTSGIVYVCAISATIVAGSALALVLYLDVVYVVEIRKHL